MVDLEIRGLVILYPAGLTRVYKFSTDHRNGTVKHCKGRKSRIEEFDNSLINQQRALRSHLDLVHSALLNNDAIKLAN